MPPTLSRLESALRQATSGEVRNAAIQEALQPFRGVFPILEDAVRVLRVEPVDEVDRASIIAALFADRDDWADTPDACLQLLIRLGERVLATYHFLSPVQLAQVRETRETLQAILASR